MFSILLKSVNRDHQRYLLISRWVQSGESDERVLLEVGRSYWRCFYVPLSNCRGGNRRVLVVFSCYLTLLFHIIVGGRPCSLL